MGAMNDETADLALRRHRSLAELDASLAAAAEPPKDSGAILMIVRRPAVDEREELRLARLDTEVGLVGDVWPTKPSSTTPDGGPNPDKQLTLMNAGAIAAIAGARDAWAPAGDQLYVELDLSFENLPTGARLALGDAVISITEPAHLGCDKFAARFGTDALRWVNSPEGRARRLRGVNARVVKSGDVRLGDAVRKLG